MAYLGIGPASFTNNLTNVQILDDIKSGFNGTEDEFDLTSNDIPFQAVSDRALMVILGGVIQAPGVDYTINGTKITFTTPPVSGLTFYARNIYGLNALNGVNDGIVGPPAFTPGGPTWDSSGNVIISGNLTVQGATTTIQSTTLDVIDKDIKLASNQSTNAGIDTAGLLWGTTAVKLKYYNNGGTNPGLNIEGTNVGIGVTAPTAKLDVDGDVKFTGATSGRNMIWDKSNDYLMVNDNARIVFGNSGDLSIRHLSSDNKSYISSTTNDVVHEFNVGKNWSLTTTAADKRIHCPAESTDKSVELYWNGSKKFATTSSGIDVTGTVVADDLIVTGTSVVADLKSTNNNNVLGIAGNNATVKTYLGTDSSGNFLLATGSGVSTRLGISAADGHITPGAAGTQNLGSTSKEFNNLYLGDGGSAYFGNDQDFQIYHHSGGNSYIKETGGGALVINADDFYLQNVATTTYLRTHSSGQIDLTHSGNTKLSTSSTGVTVTGEVAASQDYPTIKPSLDLNFAATKTLDPRIEYYRYGPASYIDANGKVVFVGADVPRFDHDPDTGECLGLLIEEERRNLFLHGLRPGDRWTGAKNGTFTENTTETTAPDGTFTATKWTFTNNDPYLYQTTTLSANTTYTISMWVKAGTNMAGDALQSRIGAAPFASSDLTIPTDGSWKRITYTKTVGGSNETSANVGWEPQTLPGLGTPASGDVIYIWGAQLESGNHASSLIPTTGSSVTRGADYAAIKGDEFTEWYNDLEGTIFTSHSLNSGVNDNSNSYVLEIGDAGSTHVAFRLQDVNSSFSNKPSWGSIYSSSATARFTGTGTFTRGNKVKSIMSGKGNDFAGTFNGETVQTDTTGSFFGPGTTGVMSIGRYGPSTGYELEGHIQRITYWPKQLTDTQLKTLTS